MNLDLYQLCLEIYFSASEEETKKTHRVCTVNRRWDSSRNALSCTAQTQTGDCFNVSIRLFGTPQTHCDCPEFYFRHAKRMKESRIMGTGLAQNLSCDHVKALAYHYLKSQYGSRS